MIVKNLVIYHANCVDGFTAAWVAWKYLGNTDTTYVPMSYGEDPEIAECVKSIYILDFSFPVDALIRMCERVKNVYLLDHHKTAIDELAVAKDKLPHNLHLGLDINRSGAGLTLDYFHNAFPKRAFSYRPQLVDYVEDRDLWRFQLVKSREVNAVIAATEMSFEAYDILGKQLESMDASINIIATGTYLLQQHNKICTEIAKEACTIIIYDAEGNANKGLCVNCTGQFASDVGNILANKCGAFGVTYFKDKNGDTKYSLRSIGDYDVSKLAMDYGGGGHKNAAGFVSKNPYARPDLTMFPQRIPELQES